VNRTATHQTSNPIRTVDVIRKKRDGGELSPDEIEHLVAGYTRGEIPDYQVAAWLMAGVLRGFTRAETAALTEAMLHSGEVLDLSEFRVKKVDKHSTGGVGDKTSFLVAPIAAAAGLVVPMISGRGLGHTGGTLDKLQSIPGFKVDLPAAEFRNVLKQCGCAIIGQTAQLAPADRKIYALRDVTGTVESPYLICASIMSKKLAEGIDGLVLDVKTGSGAFMKKEEDAALLAELMVETGERMGKRVVAVISDMDQPLGRAVGNALEIEEVISTLREHGPDDLLQLCLELAGHMLHLGGCVATATEGKKISLELVRSGQALEKFRDMIKAQGGDEGIVDHPEKLPKARHSMEAVSSSSGCVQAIQCENIGTACVILGGGRGRKEDSIDPAVGLIVRKKVGDPVAIGEPLCTILCNSQDRGEQAKKMIEQSYQIGSAPSATARPLVHRIITGPSTRRN
jgi:pyrimidine-nucleoside phosphorylase